MRYFNLFTNNKFVSFIGIIIYRLLLDYSYINIIFPTYEYQGFTLSYNKINIFLSWISLIALSPLIIKTFLSKTISTNIVTILTLVSLIPTTSMFAYSNFPKEFFYLSILYWFFILSYNFIIPSFIWNPQTNKNKNILRYTIMFFLISTVIYISYKFTGFRLHFGMFDVYDLRLEAREYDLPFYLSYLNTAANTILPIIFIYFIIENKRIFTILVAFIILLNFGIAGGKSVILLLLIAFIGYFLVKNLAKAIYFIWGFVILILCSILEKFFFDTIFISFFTTFRLLFLPSRINYIYYDFFSKNEFDFFRQSVLKWTGLESPYKENIAFLIGYFDLGEVGGRANNGLFSDAYSNFGILGIFLFPLILIIILKFIEGSTKGLDQRLLFIVSVATSMNLLSLPFSTALLTGGLLLMVIFLYSIPKSLNHTNE